MRTRSIFSVIMLITFLFTFANERAAAKWDDQSDDLPGMGGGDLTPVIIAGGAVVVTGIVVLIVVKHSKKKKMSSPQTTLSPVSPLNPYANEQQSSLHSLSKQIENAAAQSPVELYMACGNPSQNTTYNVNSGFSVGMRIRF